ncbi:hypothetical protein D3C77_508490 [compost metagenome]
MTAHHPPALTGVDTHAHIFRHDLPMVPNRRYSPHYDALVEQYLDHLDRNGLSHGVLIQPSFLALPAATARLCSGRCGCQ